MGSNPCTKPSSGENSVEIAGSGNLEGRLIYGGLYDMGKNMEKLKKRLENFLNLNIFFLI